MNDARPSTPATPKIRIEADLPSDGQATSFPQGVSPKPSAAAGAGEGWRPGGQVLITLLEAGLRGAQSIARMERFQAVAVVSAAVGRYAVLVAQVLSLVLAGIAAVKLEEPRYAWAGVGTAVWLGVMLFAADRFLNAGSAMIANSPSRLRSHTILECLALIAFFGGLTACGTRMMSRHAVDWVIGLAWWAFGSAAAWVALQPALANVETGARLSPGEEALGILDFLMKAGLRLVPFAFGAGTAAAAVGMVLASVPLLREDRLLPATRATGFALFSSALPLVAYLIFVFYHLSLDVIRAILAIPGRLSPPKEDSA